MLADCACCVGLCCIALPTTASADFGATKAAGVPCRHLLGDNRCAIHDRLRAAGWPGCASFECFGAGQRATSLLRADFGGGTAAAAGEASWRDLDDPARSRVFTAFGSLRRLHETAYHLVTTLERGVGPPLRCRGDLQAALDDVVAAIGRPLAELAVADPTPLQRRAGTALMMASAELRSARRDRGEWAERLPRGIGPGADLVGRRLTGADLRTADLRGALLVAADLRDADLRWTDLLGADLRDADLRGADLRGALFVSSPQLEAARGDTGTQLPDGLRRPRHWRSAEVNAGPSRSS